MRTARITSPDQYPRIDPEFQSHLRPLDDERFAGLEADLLAAKGPREAVVVWDEENIVVGGHHRFKICKKHGLPFTAEYRSFPDRDAVLAWMEDDQLNKRNLTDEERAYYIGRQYNREKKKHGGSLPADQVATVATSFQKTAEVVAKKHGVSPRTVAANARFADAVDSKPKEEQAKILAGEGESKKKIIASAPKLCARCKRVGPNPRVTCPECEALKRTTRKEKPKKANGSVKVDWPAFDKAYGSLVRTFDALFLGLGKKNDKDYREANAAINQLMRVIDRVKKERK